MYLDSQVNGKGGRKLPYLDEIIFKPLNGKKPAIECIISAFSLRHSSRARVIVAYSSSSSSSSSALDSNRANPPKRKELGMSWLRVSRILLFHVCGTSGLISLFLKIPCCACGIPRPRGPIA
ncbi:hypothetical protein EUGRSUZ_C02557 [Eucalyptus grandis]|uniref:Uncharacterized protein n=2 Tax=Eucalyptus grandis TaxID=71139 RepID=A0ACC3LHW0_EUCGR|nr:hypothetical protein EUGRSUZ_C02557 [Eucalyptus grandis]